MILRQINLPMKLSKKQVFILIGLLIVFLAFPYRGKAAGNTYYVATNGNDSNPGTESQPWRTIQKAANTLQPGDTVYVREGTYEENISPARSGTEGNYITYAAYPGEEVTIKYSGTIVYLRKGYIVIDGFIFDGNWQGRWVDGWKNGGHIVIKNCIGKRNNRNEYGILLTGGSHCKVLNNTLYHGQPDVSGGHGSDALKLGTGSDYSLVEGNHIENAEHCGLLIQASYVVVRNNYLYNEYNQAGESGVSDPNYHHILWERNTFTAPSTAPRDNGDAEGLQLTTYKSVVRHNIFYHSYSGGLNVKAYLYDNEEAKNVYDNRFYNNVFYKNHDSGVRIIQFHSETNMYNNVFKNNCFYENWYKHDQAKPEQILLADWSDTDINEVINNHKFFYNNIIFDAPGKNVIRAEGRVDLGSHPLSWWESNYPNSFANNLEVDPRFVDADNYDFDLQSDSTLIDAGDFLTEAVGLGSGTQIQVEDALYFSDGFGIVDADWIKIGNQAPVQINSVDYDANIVTLTESRSWDDNSPVYLYKNSMGNIVLFGGAPDIGAFEYTGEAQPTSTPTPVPPTSTPTPQPTSTPTATPTATNTPLATSTPTSTATPTQTPNPTPTPNPNELIIDNSDSRFSTNFSQDAWQEWTDVGGQHYSDTHYFNRQIGTGQDTATWSLTVPKPGRYEVYAWWWEGSYRPTDVPFTIEHLGASTTVRVNQQVDGGQWNLLGSFEFQGQGSVMVSDDVSSGQDVVVDAVRLVYLGPLPSATPTSTPTIGPTSMVQLWLPIVFLQDRM